MRFLFLHIFLNFFISPASLSLYLPINAAIGTSASGLSVASSRLLTHREAVLQFLSTCPSLTDMEAWSQWRAGGTGSDSSVGPLFQRWGDLDNFLLESGPAIGKRTLIF
ncbi:unnamed protein product [Protopolystoma xenopodis]|uniref:Secreted protein n=1 Tax=Protopolystoma xenopodis TaxID=117903 RepID=A0A3S5CLJ2_9PLAT|nr:unnamed protein product [Protopolystoma xenopodis]